jgi:tetraacyldisaccharide 4'-kinase
VADLFLLDDGFQHLSLRREADVVLVDCLHGLGNGRTLPFGPLREGASALGRAHAVVVTKCPSLAAGVEAARRLPLPAGVPVAFTGLAPTGLSAADGRRLGLPGSGWEVFAFSALARNDQFRHTLGRLGWRVASFRGFRDHHRFTRGEVADLRREAGSLPAVTTAKDRVRIPGEAWEGLLALDVEVEPLGGMEAVERVVLDRVGRRGGEGE